MHMYILLPLLLFTTPLSAEPTIENYCQEVMIEVDEAVRRGVINEQEAADIFQGCQRVK